MIKQSALFLITMIATSVINATKSHAQEVKQIEWNTNAYDIRKRLDQDFTFMCPSGGSVNYLVGTDVYTSNSSICTAAAHSGLINVRDGGQVTLRIRPGADFYNPSNRHNIKSRGQNDSYDGSFVFLGVNGQPLSSERQIKLIEWDTTAYDLRTRLDQEFTFDCPRNGILSYLSGTGLYTSNSSICSSAVHQGVISNLRGGTVTILIRAGASSYRGSIRNGVKSRDYGEYDGSFSFVKKRSNASESPTKTIADISSEPSTDKVAKTIAAPFAYQSVPPAPKNTPSKMATPLTLSLLKT